MSSYYLTTKLVEVKPMLAIDAENAGYRTNDVVDEMPGYEVLYSDGYKSWCPKAVFDKNAVKLKEISTFTAECKDTMPDFLKRMFDEHNELRNKFSKLLEFINSPKFLTLSENQKEKLNKQHMFMLGYLNILRERIIDEITIFAE